MGPQYLPESPRRALDLPHRTCPELDLVAPLGEGPGRWSLVPTQGQVVAWGPMSWLFSGLPTTRGKQQVERFRIFKCRIVSAWRPCRGAAAAAAFQAPLTLPGAPGPAPCLGGRVERGRASPFQGWPSPGPLCVSRTLLENETLCCLPLGASLGGGPFKALHLMPIQRESHPCPPGPSCVGAITPSAEGRCGKQAASPYVCLGRGSWVPGLGPLCIHPSIHPCIRPFPHAS